MGGTQSDESGMGPTDTASETTEDVPATCDCPEHKGQLIIDSTYSLSAKQLFRFLFTENKIMDEFLKSTKRTDRNTGVWAESDEKSRGLVKKARTATYTVELTNSWGPKTSDVTERQTFIEIGKQSADGYVVKKEASNAGVPYGDSFNIYCCYCITRVTSDSCRLQVHAGLEFKKSVMGMFKGFIERMSISGLNEYYKSLDSYIKANTTNVQREFSNTDDDDLTSNRDSLRSECNDGYISDLDEREDLTKKRLARTISYAARSNVIASANSGIDRSLLIDINNSLRIIALILLMLLFIQLWSCLWLKSTDTEDLLSRLISLQQSLTK